MQMPHSPYYGPLESSLCGNQHWQYLNQMAIDVTLSSSCQQWTISPWPSTRYGYPVRGIHPSVGPSPTNIGFTPEANICVEWAIGLTCSHDWQLWPTFQQFTRFFQGACISKALWSSSRDFGPLPKLQFVNSESNDWQPPSTHAYPLLCNLPDVCNMKTQSSLQMCSCHLDSRVPQIQQPPGKSFNPSIAILFLLDLDMGTSPFQAKFTISQSASLENQQYLHPLRKTLVKSQNWCKCWIAAIIQRHWETAWDLDTHQNIKDGATGAWLAHLTALCQCVGSGCTPSPQYPFYQFSNFWIGHLTGYPSKNIN